MNDRAGATGDLFWGEAGENEALQYYRTLLNTIDEGVWQLDIEGHFVAVDDSILEITGYAREELLGEPLSVLFDGDDLSVIEHKIERLHTTSTDRSELLELTVQTAEGEEVRCELQVNLLEADRTTRGTVGIVRDITEHSQTEREPGEHKSELEARSAAMEETVDGIAILDENEEYVFVNQAHTEIYGYDDPETFLGESWRLCYDDQEIHRLEAEVMSVLREEGSWRGEATGVCKDGSTFPQELSLTVLDDGRYVCIVRDITERTEREVELERYKTIVETVNDGVYVVDSNSNFQMVNETYAEMVGYTRDELIGSNASKVVDEDVIQQAQEWESARRSGNVQRPTMEGELQTADGNEVPVEATFAPLTTDENSDWKRVGVVRDISRRRERERELAKSERRYRALAEHFPNGLVALFNHDLEYTLAAGQGFEDIPVDPDVAEGESFRDVWDDATADALEPILQAALDNEEQSVELEYAGREWIVYSVPITDEGGDVFAGMTMAQDITERKESQRQLAESEQRYRTLIENFPNGAVALFDEDLQYTIAGGDMIETVGIDTTEIVGETIWERYPETVAAQFEPRFRAALDGETNEFEFSLHDRHWRAYTLPVRDDSGDIFAGMVMVQDITEQKERERYLSDAKAQLEAAAEAGAVGTWEWHIPEDNFVTGASLARKFGVDPEAARDGVPLDRIVSSIHEADRERVKRQIEDVVESGGEYEAEYRVWDDDDELRWVVARGHVECDEDGNPVTFPGALTDITERKENERKVEESERRYRTLVENFPNGAVGLFDEELRYTAVGGQFLDEVDISKEERLGQSIYEVYPDELVTEVEPYFDAALSGETNSFEVEYHDRSLFAHTLPVRNGDDEVFAGMLVIQDVTERREAQRELRESEAKFRMLAENLEEIVWMTTPDVEEFIYINPAFEEVWGLDREELYDEPLSFLETVHPDDRERVQEGFTALPEEEFDDEFRITQSDGEIRWVRARGTRVNDEDGEMVRVVGTGEDITERKKRERQLEQSERRYRTLAEHFPNGAVSVYDHDLRFTLAQGGVMGNTLPSREQVEGRTVPEVYPPDIVEDLEPLLRAAVEEGETGSAMFEFGGRHWRVWATPLRDGDHDVFAGLSFAQDVTEQVEREQRLEQVIDKLETSNERLEQFAYAASHDLQEPLRMVSSYLQLIERRYADSFDEDGEEFLEFAVDGADRMRKMIDGLLKYSRVETRGNTFEPVALDAILADVREDLQVRIEESNAEITTDSLPRVRGDTGQLRQVFQNLLDNAIEYSGDEPPRIHVSAERGPDKWKISVHDEGIGIDPAEADRIFEVFQSLHAPDDHSGTGIGLALCERIIERHGGDIWVEPEPDEGATFYFTLPTAGDQEM